MPLSFKSSLHHQVKLRDKAYDVLKVCPLIYSLTKFYSVKLSARLWFITSLWNEFLFLLFSFTISDHTHFINWSVGSLPSFLRTCKSKNQNLIREPILCSILFMWKSQGRGQASLGSQADTKLEMWAHRFSSHTSSRITAWVWICRYLNWVEFNYFC